MCFVFEESISALPFWEFQASTFYQKQVPESGSTLYQLCIMLASCPSLRCSCRKKRVSCREAEGLVAQLWSPRFVKMQCLCSQFWYETAASQRTLVEIELLAIVLWKCGCQPFSCQCSKNVTPRPKEICLTCLSKESIPATPFGISKHPLPTRSRFLRAKVRSTSSGLCLHHAHPFVSATGKNLSYAERQRVW